MDKSNRMSEDALIEVLHQTAIRHNAESGLTVQRLSEQQVRSAEKRLGFRLPPLIRRLYLELGNGEFGPGLLPLIHKGGLRSGNWPRSIVAAYRAIRESALSRPVLADAEEHVPRLQWWEMLLLICDWGCSMFIFVDCSKPELPVYLADSGYLELQASSLREWLTDWVETWVIPDSTSGLRS